MWATLAIAALAGGSAPAPAPAIAVVLAGGACRLAPAGSGAECPCRATPARIRLLFSLPLPLNASTAEDLRGVPGIGPARSAAIVRERERGGAFASVEALLRVDGLGPTTVQRLRSFVFVGEDDPACAPTRAFGRS